MRPVSDEFLRTVRGSHKMLARARVCESFQTGNDPIGTEIPIIDGDVQFDSTADVRATLDLTTSWEWAADAGGLLTPYGNEVFVERGIEFGNGTQEWVSLGYYRIYTVEQENAPAGEIRITGKDRMSTLIDAKPVTPIQFFANHTAQQFFEGLVLDVLPDALISYDFDAAGITVGRTVVVEEDRYAALLEMCRSLGKVMFFDHDGSLRIKTPPDPADPVYEVNHGADGVLVSMSRSLSRDSAYNGLVVTGEAPDGNPPVRAVARDMNPRSATYWGGKFGQVPSSYSSSFITTMAQARTSAAALLRRNLGVPYNVDFSAVPNPALEPLDPVNVTFSYRDRSEVHVIEKLNIPLTPDGGMSASTREQTLVTVNVSDQ